ncbi:hypothetical protein J6590_029981 [Homalodisca vitripennis]|nr:hypothetical protein J6590_029981 [Homalodisca vitripennis]
MQIFIISETLLFVTYHNILLEDVIPNLEMYTSRQSPRKNGSSNCTYPGSSVYIQTANWRKLTHLTACVRGGRSRLRQSPNEGPQRNRSNKQRTIVGSARCNLAVNFTIIISVHLLPRALLLSYHGGCYKFRDQQEGQHLHRRPEGTDSASDSQNIFLFITGYRTSIECRPAAPGEQVSFWFQDV